MADVPNVPTVNIKDPELFTTATALTELFFISRRGGLNKKLPGEDLPAKIITATPGSYSNANITIASDGRITSVSTGVGGGGSVSEANVTVTGANVGYSLRVVYSGASAPTCSFASNKYTMVIPNNVRVLSADFLITGSDVQASADASGATNWVLFEFQGTGGNTGVANVRIPSVQKGAIPSGTITITNAIAIDIDNNPALTVVGVASGNIILRASALAVGVQGYHLKFSNV